MNACGFRRSTLSLVICVGFMRAQSADLVSTSTIPLGANLCQFLNEPLTPYAWDPKCSKIGADHLGCKADGVSQNCRFCGASGYAPCPSWTNLCYFENEPRTPYTWDSTCNDEGWDHLGCKADGKHQECRFCGEGDYNPCPACELESAPNVRVVWDNACKPGVYTNGCLADNTHFECRFCGGSDYDACPSTTSTSTTSETLPTTIASRIVSPGSKSSSSSSTPPPRIDRFVLSSAHCSSWTCATTIVIALIGSLIDS